MSELHHAYQNIYAIDDEVVRLNTENKLLRASSEEQRKLNGSLRTTIQLHTDSLEALTAFLNWFGIWGIMLDGSCHEEAVEIADKYTAILDEENSKTKDYS